MPPSDEATLVLAITKAVQKASVWDTAGGFYGIPYSWGPETLTQLDDSLAKALRRHLDDGALNSYLRHFLAVRFLKAGHEFPSKARKLTSYKGFDNSLDISQEVVDSLKTLPLRYELSVRASSTLSKMLYRPDVDFQISDRLRIVSSEIISESVPLQHSLKPLDEWIKDRGGPLQFSPVITESLYFLYKSSGCISDKHDSKLAREFSDELRAFYGACFAYNVLHDYGDDSGNELVPLIVASSDGVGKNKELAYVQRADTDLIRATYVETSLEFDKLAKEQRPIEDLLSPIKDMFRSEDSLRLKTSASWLLRANQSAREMDQVLESTIALEVLLGDRDASDRVGLSKLMANRCAYSLGSSATERKQLIDFFIRFYKVRSDIVHSGTFKVSEAERAVVSQGLDLAHRVLRHEVAVNSPGKV